MSADNEVKKEVSKETKVEKPKTEKIEPKAPIQSGETKVNLLVSETDAFILDRMKSQPSSLDAVDVMVAERVDDRRHRLSLPDELESFTKKYAFCWIFKRKQAIDEACDIYHWVLCNRNHFSDLPDHLFTARGVIERGDNILAFRPKHIDDQMRRVPGVESTELIKARTKAHENDPAFYVPDSDEWEVGPDGKRRKVPVVGV